MRLPGRVSLNAGFPGFRAASRLPLPPGSAIDQRFASTLNCPVPARLQDLPEGTPSTRQCIEPNKTAYLRREFAPDWQRRRNTAALLPLWARRRRIFPPRRTRRKTKQTTRQRAATSSYGER